MLNPETVRAANAFIRKYSLFPPLDIENPLYAEHHVVLKDSELVGFGMLKLVSEAIMVVNPNLSSACRAKTIEELALTCIYKSQQRGLDEVHAFLTGPDAVALAKMLKRHFGFEDIIGIPLVMRLRNGKRTDSIVPVDGPTELQQGQRTGDANTKLSLG